MFDWVPKKNISSSETDINNHYILNTLQSETPVEGIAGNLKEHSEALVNIDKEAENYDKKTVFEDNKMPQNIKKAPAIPTQTNPQESIENIELKLIEPTFIANKRVEPKQDVQEFFIDNNRVSPKGAASIYQDAIRSNKVVQSSLNETSLLKLLRYGMSDSVQPLENSNETKEEQDEKLIKTLTTYRYPYHSGKENFDKELRTTSSSYTTAFADTQSEPPMIIVDDFGDRSLWELQLNNSNLPGMELKEYTLINFDHIYINEMRKGFKRARRDFIKYICYNYRQDLFAAGITETDMGLLRKGYACENFNVHRKVPYEYGGNNDFSNFCFMQTHPYHDNLHEFLDMQVFIHPKGTKVKRLFIPIPIGSVYKPYFDFTGSGGKSTDDRSVYAGFDEGTFNIIAQKTAMGKAAEL